jgi:DNA-binding HxlR family transcriptional regulator
VADVSSPEFLPGWYDARALLAAEWAPAIAVALLDGPLSYKEILAAAQQSNPSRRWSARHDRLHESILSRTLRGMTRDGLLERQEDAATFPPTVRYQLTDDCRTLLEKLAPMADWARDHQPMIDQAQQRRRSEQAELPPGPEADPGR